jgi:hypothetical protein
MGVVGIQAGQGMLAKRFALGLFLPQAFLQPAIFILHVLTLRLLLL